MIIGLVWVSYPTLFPFLLSVNLKQYWRFGMEGGWGKKINIKFFYWGRDLENHSQSTLSQQTKSETIKIMWVSCYRFCLFDWGIFCFCWYNCLFFFVLCLQFRNTQCIIFGGFGFIIVLNQLSIHSKKRGRGVMLLLFMLM